ncbi:MAG: N-acetyltransferase [Firmicutes bacterium]|nr:N-acetyltransferase [Bacillota bacterium]
MENFTEKLKINGYDCLVRLETAADHWMVENLVRESFWNVYRPGCLEHFVLHCLRNDADFVPELNLVLEKDGEIIGQVMYMRAKIAADDGRVLPIMTFGPIAIAPQYKRQGYGKVLLDYSLARAAQMGAGAVCIEGNIDFYGQSGFVLAGTRGIRYHGEPDAELLPYFLLKELQPGFLDGVSGVYHTPTGYYVDETVAEEFDRQFAPKQKLKLPGQLF